MIKENKKLLKMQTQAYLLLAPALLILFMLLVFPLFQVFRMSLYDVDFRNDAFVGLKNYINLFHDPAFGLAIRNTIIFTVASVVFHFVIGLLLALLLNSSINSKIQGFFRGLFILPWLIAPTVASMIWVLIYNPFGVLNGVLIKLGLMSKGTAVAWLGNPALALMAVTIVNIWRGYPFTMVMLLAGLQGIPVSLYEASMIDGASPFKQFLYITLPSLKEVALTVGLLDVIWTFRHFDTIFTMTGGGPMHASEVLATHIYNNAFRVNEWGYASAEAVLMFLLMLIVGLFYVFRIADKK